MSLSDLTDPAAVKEAIAEFDRLTRDVFLHRYDFGRAREYFLIYKGREYDSKAIVGAAYGYQFPDRGPLGPHDFSGGDATVVPKLDALGFTVRRRTDRPDARVSARQCWALVANPSMYDVDAALAAGGLDSWTSRGRPLRPGDGIILWRTRGRDGRRGIVAIGEVAGEPFRSSDEKDRFWVDRNAAALVEDRVPIRLFDAPGLPLWLDGEHGAVLQTLNVARATGGTVFHVTDEQWMAIADLAGANRVQSPAEESIEDLVNPLRRRGQGRGLSAEERKAVELRAMDLAKAHYGARWDAVRDISSRECYDLECRSGDRFLRVEVKGTTGGASSVLVTANEVNHARQLAGSVALFVASEIVLHRTPGSEPTASGGTVRILEPWEIDQCSLRAVAYECALPSAVPGVG
jgi:hypothetical protein